MFHTQNEHKLSYWKIYTTMHKDLKVTPALLHHFLCQTKLLTLLTNVPEIPMYFFLTILPATSSELFSLQVKSMH